MYDRRNAILVVIVVSSLVLGYYAMTRFKSTVGGETIWVQTNNPSKSFDIAHAVVVDNSGIYIVGYDYSTRSDGGPSWRIEKRNLVDGTPMWTQANPITSPGRAYDVAVDPSGIYVVGICPSPRTTGYYDDQEWRVEKRSLTNGALIWNQTTRIDAPGGADARAIAVDASGIYVVGNIVNSTGSWLWRIEKRDLTSGAIVWVETSPGVLGVANSVVVDSSGIYVVGYDQSGYPVNYFSWRIEKRNVADGKLLWYHRIQMLETHAPSTATDNPGGIAVDASGVYVAVTDQGFRIEKRNLADGTLIWTQTSQVSIGLAKDMTIDISGVYIVGYDAPASNADDEEWRIEKRNKTDGTLEWVQTRNIATATSSFENSDVAEHVAVDGSTIYVVGMDTLSSGNCEWRIEKRATG